MAVARCSLSLLLVLNTASQGAAQEAISPKATSPKMRQEAPQNVQIGAHASFSADVDPRDNSDMRKLVGSAPQVVSLAQKSSAKRSQGPKLTGYESNDCGGKKLGSYVLPMGADLVADQCIEVRDPDTDVPSGRVKIGCDGSGVAQACIWHNANDTTCSLSEPFCLSIQAEDTAKVSTGDCIPVEDHPTENFEFVRFTDFPEDTKWPDCLLPALTQQMMITAVAGGIGTGLVVLAVIWYSAFAPASPHPKHMDFKGKGKGKGWEEAPHPSGEVDASGNPLPASLPGVPALISDGGKGMPDMNFKGKGMPDPSVMKGMAMDPNMKGMAMKGKGYFGK